MSTAKNIPSEIIEQAVEWLLRQQAAVLSEQEQIEFQQWLAQSQQHQRAWQCAEYFSATVNILPKQHSENILEKAHHIHIARLANVGKLILLFTVSILGYFSWQSDLRYRFIAEYATKVGEQKQIKLSDGSQIYLNTNTALDTHFDQQQRLIELHYGEIQIRTAKDPAAIKRPFIVQTEHGSLEALGTVFNVKQIDDQTCIAVIESAVRVKAYHLKPVIIQANQQLCFNQNTYQAIQKININQQLWQKGLFAAYDLPLGQFIDEIKRYHTAYIFIDQDSSHVRISGAYPIQDLSKTLRVLQQTYPISVNMHVGEHVVSIKKSQ